jgi:hypothetical protein
MLTVGSYHDITLTLSWGRQVLVPKSTDDETEVHECMASWKHRKDEQNRFSFLLKPGYLP